MKVKIFWLIALIIPFLAHGQDQSRLTSDQKVKLDLIAMQDVPKGAPGIATGIVVNGKIVYEKYSGYANLKGSILITNQSRFNIASNGKQFTAFAILNLIEDNKLSLQDDIRTFFPKLYPTIDKKIKIEQLLTHTSGIRDVYDLWGLQGITWWEHSYNIEDALDLLSKQEELNFEPGEKYSYSNSNYILLAEIVSKVSGTGFISYTNEMFKSLNMPNTFFVSNYKTIDEPIAKPYFNFDTWVDYKWIWNIYGDGNIFSTLEDQLTWEKTLQTKKNDRFSKEVLEKSQLLLPTSSTKIYGYGLEFSKYKNIPFKFHEGSTGAWNAITARFPKQNISIVTLTNSGKTNPRKQTLESADVLLGNDPSTRNIKLTPEKVGNYVSINDVLGHYIINDEIMQFVERKGKLYLLRSGRNDMKLVRESNNVFQQWNDAPFKQEFVINKNGEMQVTFYYTATQPFTLTRIDADFTDFDFKSLKGSFLNKETDVSFSIKHKSEKTYLVKYGKQKITAFILSPDQLVANEYKIAIKRDQNNNISDLLLTSGRIQNIKFSRVE